MSAQTITRYTKAEIDALSTVGTTATPHVVVVGVRHENEWTYAISDPMSCATADESVEWMRSHGRINADSVAFTRPVQS